jgi:hypothetical protein
MWCRVTDTISYALETEKFILQEGYLYAHGKINGRILREKKRKKMCPLPGC